MKETPAQTCARIVTALEDLARQEAAVLQSRNFSAAVLLQERAAPLVEHLVAHEGDVTSSDLRSRIAAVSALRSQTGEWLATQIERAREELQQMDASQRRIARVAPVYGSGTPRRSQLSVVG